VLAVSRSGGANLRRPGGSRRRYRQRPRSVAFRPSESPRGHAISTDERYKLGSLGDLVALLIDGWQIQQLHYADCCEPAGEGPAGAFFDLRRSGDEEHGIYIPEDERTFSNRSLVALFRESSHIWKHRSAERIMKAVDDAPTEDPRPPEEWGEVLEPFPEALALTPDALRSVVPVLQTEAIDGVTIALTALERFEHGARVRYLARATDPRQRGTMDALDVLAVDDRGRRYRTATIDVTREGNRSEGSLMLAPAIPSDVLRLTVTIGTVGDRSLGENVAGPWVFPIPLPAHM
jgi:hypothetical protein